MEGKLKVNITLKEGTRVTEVADAVFLINADTWGDPPDFHEEEERKILYIDPSSVAYFAITV